MENNNTSNVINGELRIGDTVVSRNADEYSYLAGIVISVAKHGSPEHDTGNPSDDIHVNFSALEYSPRRVSEIEGEFRKAYGDNREFDELPLDDVIMSPDMLIRANNIDLTNRDEMDSILDSDEGAMAFCNRVLSAHGLNIDGLSATVTVEEPAITMAKLYSPVFVDLWERDEYGDYPAESIELDQSTAAYHIDEIRAALLNERDPDEAGRGLMTYYHEDDSVNDKVRSLTVDVDLFAGKLWAVSNLEVTEPLTVDELDKLRDYITGQFSDGFGEGFEQREIKIDDGELNVHLWSSGDEFFIETQAQFAQRITQELPPDVLSQLAPPLTPAQAALVEPDMFDSQDVSALRDRLIERLDGNLSDFFDSINRLEGVAITGFSSRIAVMAEAHHHLTEQHNFHTSELNYLLQFKNPLEVVADEFEAAVPDNFRHAEMWRIFDKQEALQANYERMPEPIEPSADATPKGYVIAVTDDGDSYVPGITHIERDDGLSVYADDGAAAKAAEKDGIALVYGIPFIPDGVYLDTPENREALTLYTAPLIEAQRLSLFAEAGVRDTLHDRLDENFAAYKAETLRLGKSEIYDSVVEIATVQQAYEYFRNEHHFTTGQAEFLLKLQNPLVLLSDRLPLGIEHKSDAVEYIFGESTQEWVLNSGSYELASDDPDTPPTTVSTQDKGTKAAVAGVGVSAGEKPSVIDEIRQSQKEARERPTIPKEQPSPEKVARKKSDPDL